MKFYKDEFNIDCFKIKVNNISDFQKRCGIKTEEYLASSYMEHYYMIRNKGIFGVIIEKEKCTILN